MCLTSHLRNCKTDLSAFCPLNRSVDYPGKCIGVRQKAKGKTALIRQFPLLISNIINQTISKTILWE